MALATQCPHCNTRFRVAADQLKLRGGIVRCGACQSIFDGSAHLIELDAPLTPRVAEAPAPPPQVPHDAHVDHIDHIAAEPVAMRDADPATPQGDPLAHLLDTPAPVDMDAAPEVASSPDEPETELALEQDPAARDEDAPHGDPLDHLVEVIADAPPSFAPQGRIEPRFDLPVDEELVAQPMRGAALDDDIDAEDAAAAPFREPAPEPASEPAQDDAQARAPALTPAGSDDDATASIGLPLRASAGGEGLASATVPGATLPRSARSKALEARTRRSKLTPTKIEAPKLRVAEADEPEFVKRSRKLEQAGHTRRIAMAAGTVVLLLVLAAQLVLDFGNVTAARHPGARPALDAACALLGCRIGLPTQIDNLAIENGELTNLGPDTYALATLLRNQGSLVQAWPSIELELTDAGNKPVLRRVFAPNDYLAQGGAAQAIAAGFGARSEQPVKLHFALAGLKPSDYHIVIFYP